MNDLQMGHATREAKLGDIKATTSMSVNTNFLVLHFSDDEIVSNVDNRGLSRDK